MGPDEGRSGAARHPRGTPAGEGPGSHGRRSRLAGPRPEADDEPDDGWRTTQNLVATIVLILLLAAGWWTVDALVRTKRALDCLQAGRTRCPGVEAPR